MQTALLPDRISVSVISIAELQVGVLAAKDTATRSRRLRTLEFATALTPLPVDASAAQHWATLRMRLHETGRRLNVNDLWIASIALANGLPVITQDADFEALSDIGGPTVIHV